MDITFKRNDECDHYAKYKVKDQTAEITFQFFPDEYYKNTLWNVVLVVYNKRKHAQRNLSEVRCTGHHGIEFLLFAKEAIQEFEKSIVETYPTEKHVIYVGWADNRRRNVYERGLKPIGYNYEMIDGVKCLAKHLN